MNNPKKSWFNRDDKGPAANQGPDVKKISGDDKLYLVVCSLEVQGYWTHWDLSAKRTVACQVNKQLCQHCLSFQPMRWAGFVHCCNTKHEQSCFVELTALARDNLLEALPDGEKLRGAKFLVNRERKTAKSPLVFEYLGRGDAAKVLPLPADPEQLLRRLWRIND